MHASLHEHHERSGALVGGAGDRQPTMRPGGGRLVPVPREVRLALERTSHLEEESAALPLAECLAELVAPGSGDAVALLGLCPGVRQVDVDEGGHPPRKVAAMALLHSDWHIVSQLRDRLLSRLEALIPWATPKGPPMTAQGRGNAGCALITVEWEARQPAESLCAALLQGDLRQAVHAHDRGGEVGTRGPFPTLAQQVLDGGGMERHLAVSRSRVYSCGDFEAVDIVWPGYGFSYGICRRAGGRGGSFPLHAAGSATSRQEHLVQVLLDHLDALQPVEEATTLESLERLVRIGEAPHPDWFDAASHVAWVRGKWVGPKTRRQLALFTACLLGEDLPALAIGTSGDGLAAS